MKKSTVKKRKAPAKKSTASRKPQAGASSTSSSASSGNSTPLVGKQPQSKTAAAASAGMFLYTDSKWSDAYFDPNDLRSMERQVFGG